MAILLSCTTYEMCIIVALSIAVICCNFATMIVDVFSHDTVNTACVTHIRLSGVACDGKLGSATYGTILSINLYKFGQHGTLPTSIGSFQSMTSMAIRDSIISGTIPSTIGLLTSLATLRLSNNRLFGSIPSSIGNIKSLKSLFMGSNLLNGTIPSSFSGLSLLYYIDMQNNALNGTLDSVIGSLTILTFLYLNNNLLSGTIPSTMSQLGGLIYLNFSNNFLTMGSSATLSSATFSRATLFFNSYSLEGNCIEYHYKDVFFRIEVNVWPTHCRRKL